MAARWLPAGAAVVACVTLAFSHDQPVRVAPAGTGELRLAQTEPSPPEELPSTPTAAPLTPDEMAPLWAALPPDADAFGLVHVGQLLGHFGHLLNAVDQLAGDVPVEEAQAIYETHVRPLADHLRTCVGWVRNDLPTLACVGDFSDEGWNPAREEIAACVANPTEQCGVDEDSFPGMTVAFNRQADFSLYLADDRLLVFSQDDAMARAVIMQAGEDAGGDALPSLGETTIDPSAVAHFLLVVPPDARDSLAQELGFPLVLDRMSVRLSEAAEGGIDLLARIGTGSATNAEQLLAVAHLVLTQVATEEPETLTALGLDASTVLGWVTADGADLVLRVEGGTALGVLAAIGIPAVVTYVRRSKAVEAEANLRRLFDSAFIYYDASHTNPAGEVLPPQFPRSTPLNPLEVPCGESAATPAEQWESPTWQALNFALSEPHYYSYQFDSAGIGPNAAFTASAFGDLDCDGVRSTFVRLGTVDATGVVRSRGEYRENELE